MDLTNEDIANMNEKIKYKEIALKKKEEQLANAKYFIEAFNNYKVQVNIFEMGTPNHVCLQLGGQFAYDVVTEALEQYGDMINSIKKDIAKLKRNDTD